jgi:hypothetical protein
MRPSAASLGLSLALGLMLSAAPLQAAEDGGQPFAFSKLPVGARSAALGNAQGALAGDAYGMVQNPALLATLDELQLGSELASLALGSSQQFVGLGRPMESGSQSAYGLAYHRSAEDDPIEKRDSNTPDPESTFSNSSNIFTAGVATWLSPQKLAIGLNLKVLGQSLGDASAGGYSGDLGFFMRTWRWLDLGLDIQDFASRVTWNSGETESLPLLVRGGAVAHAWDQRLLFSLNVEKSQVQDFHAGLGAEFWAWPKILALRAGWDDGQWSAGFGLQTGAFGLVSFFNDGGLDYAVSSDPVGNGAVQQRLSLNLGFSLD